MRGERFLLLAVALLATLSSLATDAPVVMKVMRDKRVLLAHAGVFAASLLGTTAVSSALWSLYSDPLQPSFSPASAVISVLALTAINFIVTLIATAALSGVRDEPWQVVAGFAFVDLTRGILEGRYGALIWLLLGSERAVRYEVVGFGVLLPIAVVAVIVSLIILALVCGSIAEVEERGDVWTWYGAFIALMGVAELLLVLYPPILTYAGIFVPLLAPALTSAGIVALAVSMARKLGKLRPSEGVRAIKAIFLIATIILSASYGAGIYASWGHGRCDYEGAAWGLSLITYTYNISEVPALVDNLRLIDRKLARDFFSTFSLPPSPKQWFVEKLVDYECIGVVDGRPAWIMPLKYQTMVGKARDTNRIAGFLWIYLTDTPLPENIRYEFYEMDVGFGLESYRNLEVWASLRFPDYYLGEWYVIKDSKGWAWVLLLDKYVGSAPVTSKVVVVRGFDDYEVLTPEEAVRRGIPQVISSRSITGILKLVGNYLRAGIVDPTAPGVPFLVPESPDRLMEIETAFYQRPHHFLIGSNWFGRDYYMFVKPAQGMESVVLAVAINDSIRVIDLRGYRRGKLQGVSLPDDALSVLEEVADEQIGYGIVAVRYPKLYRLSFENETVLVWIALLVEEVAGGDILRGVAFVDAVNMRIKGLIQYSLGEGREVFIERVKKFIATTYESFSERNETFEIREGRIRNGTILAKGWVLEDEGEEFVLTFRIDNGTNVVVAIARRDLMESQEQWYLASTLQPGDRVNMDLRFDPERQVWLIYRIELLS